MKDCLHARRVGGQSNTALCCAPAGDLPMSMPMTNKFHLSEPNSLNSLHELSQVKKIHAKEQRMTDVLQSVGIVSEASAQETNGKHFFFVGPHRASSQTSVRQTLHLTKSVTTWCVGMSFSSLIDSSVLGVVCFACLWKCGLCLQAPSILLSELTRSCRLNLDCLRIAIPPLAHKQQFLVTKVLTTVIGFPCQMMLQVVSPDCLTGGGFAQWNCVAKCFA